MPISSSLQSRRRLGDVFRWLAHQGFCLVSAKLVNPVAAAITINDPCGLPVKASGSNYVIVQAADEANAIGLLYFDGGPISLASSGTSDLTYPFLIRGPALIDRDALPTQDVAVSPGTYTIATLVTSFTARNIISQVEPTKTSTQTT